jgi:hypothetical protein
MLACRQAWNNNFQRLVRANSFFGHSPLLESRIFTEKYATDSFQNTLFPLLLFPNFVRLVPKSHTHVLPPQQQPAYPAHLTMISHAFKRHRFTALHLPALKWPTEPERLHYIGIDPPMNEAKRVEVEAGELCKGVLAWEHDLYGAGGVLMKKRRARGWTLDREQMLWKVAVDALDGTENDDMTSFLDWLRAQREEGNIYPNPLPWFRPF